MSHASKPTHHTHNHNQLTCDYLSEEVVFSLSLFCLLVCLLAGLRQNNSTGFHKIRGKGSTRALEESV